MGPIVHPDDYSRWQYVAQGMKTEQSERDGWLCMAVSFTVAMVVGGLVGLIMAKTWLPMWARAVITLAVFAGALYAAWTACQARKAAEREQAESGAGEAAPKPVTRTVAPAPVAAAAPAAAAAVEPAEEVGTRPAALDGARGGTPDDLTKIKGVGPKLAELCHSLGFYHFDQIAAWTGDEVAWVDENLEGFKGRVSRDDWVAQAAILAEGGETEFSARQ